MANLLTTEVRAAADFLLKLSTTLSQETTIRQAMVLFAVAQAGDSGIDSATLEKKVQMSAAAVSRTIRLLSAVSYDHSEGHGLITLELDPMDNRRRVIRINAKGEKAVLKMVSGLSKA